MKNTSRMIFAAVQELAANKPEVQEALAIVERLTQCYCGFQGVAYEWIATTKSHGFRVQFSGRADDIVAIHQDICTAIVLINHRVMNAFKHPEPDLSNPQPTALECREVMDLDGNVITDAFLSSTPPTDLRTEYASAS